MIITGTYEGDKADVWSIGCILLELLFGHRRCVRWNCSCLYLSLCLHVTAVDAEQRRRILDCLTSASWHYAPPLFTKERPSTHFSRFIDVWMSAYDYEVLQSKDVFTKDIKDTVDELPKSLTFSPPLNDFITQLLILNPKNRPKIRDICMHPWLDGAFEGVLVPKSTGKHKLKKRPSITDAVSQSDSALNIGGKSKVPPKGEEGSKEDTQPFTQMAFDDLSIPTGLKGSTALSLPRLQKEKPLLHPLDVKEANQMQKTQSAKGKVIDSPRVIGGKSTNSGSKKSVNASPSSCASAVACGEESMAENLNDTALNMKNTSKSIRASFDSMSSEMLVESLTDTRRSSELDLSSRLGMALPPIVDGMNSRAHDGAAFGVHDEADQIAADSSSLSAMNAHGLVNAAIYSLSRGGSKRVEMSSSPQTQGSPLDPDGSSGGNSCNSAGSGSGVSFFGYGNRQFSAPRGSFANDFSVPRGSFANDAYTNPRGSFVSECGANARSSFFSEVQKNPKEHLIKTSCIPSMASSVTVSPIGATPLATPTASGTPTLRNIEEEADEMTSIDELRNFLSGGSFSFLGSK